MKIDERDEIKKAYKHQLVSLYILVVVVVVSFLGLQVHRYNIFMNYDYFVYERLSAFANLLFLVPIALLIYMYFGLNYLRLRGLALPKLKTTIKTFFVVTLIFGMCSLSVYHLNEERIYGVLIFKDKIQEGNNYYLITDDTKIRVTENEFNLVDINKEYMGSYRRNSFSPSKGNLLTINTD